LPNKATNPQANKLSLQNQPSKNPIQKPSHQPKKRRAAKQQNQPHKKKRQASKAHQKIFLEF